MVPFYGVVSGHILKSNIFVLLSTPSYLGLKYQYGGVEVSYLLFSI